jgi:hypothetical protein
VTNYAADQPTTNGTTGNQRTGTASSDAVPAGSLLLVQNTGAGSHNFDLGVNFSYDGLNPGSVATGPGKRRITIGAGAFSIIRVKSDAGDANGLCSVTIDGTASEVKYFVLGA